MPKIINPSVKVLAVSSPTMEFHLATGLSDPEHIVEYAGRNCYQSQHLMSDGTHEKIIKHTFIAHQHESVLEHASVTFEIVTDRAIMGQITRHRMASYSIESARYCNYSRDKFDNEIKVIVPHDIRELPLDREVWLDSVKSSEASYFKLMELGTKAETARSVLPQSLATKIVMTMNLRSLRNFLQLRLGSHAQSDIREIAEMMKKEASEHFPEYMFEDLA